MCVYSSVQRFLVISISAITILLAAHVSVFGEPQGKEIEGKAGLKVTVLLFSGRPDPVYVLDDKETIEKIKILIRSAKVHERFEKPTVIPSILGYKGIIVENQEKIAGIPALFAVYKGNIEVKNEAKKFLIDEGRAIEDLLLSEAVRKGVIDEKIIKRMKSEK